MKNYFGQLLLVAVLLFVGCSDPCKDVDCGPGTCDDGTCICPDGYEGTSCETLEVEKFLGTYTVTSETCDDGTTSDLETMVLDVRTGGTPFDVSAALSDGDETFSFDGTLTEGMLVVSGTVDGTLLEVEGTITSNIFTGKIDIGDGLISCDYTMEK